MQLAPELPEAWYNLGIAYGGIGKRNDALQALEKARVPMLNSPDAQNAIGLQLLELRAYDDAERCLNRALALAPSFAYAHSNLGKLREMQGRLREAETSFNTAIRIQPNLAPAYANLGAVLNLQSRYTEAVEACGKAVNLDASLSEAWNNLGSGQSCLKQFDKAVASYEKALSLEPNTEYSFGGYLHAKMNLCDWSSLPEHIQQLIADVSLSKPVISPFGLLGLVDDPALQHTAARTFSETTFPKRDVLGPYPPPPRPQDSDRLLLGRFSQSRDIVFDGRTL